MPCSFNAKFIERTSCKTTFKENKNIINAGFDVSTNIHGNSLSDDMPLMDGDAKAGTSKMASRSDHVHPHDSEKMNYMSAISNMELEAMLT